MKRLRARLTYANVVASMALFIALAGGTAFAAGFGKETIGSRALKKEAVTPAKLSVASKATLVGPTGAKGAPGSTGPAGPRGATGISNQIVIQKTANGSVFASCNPGEKLTGGGAIGGASGLQASYPNTDGSTPSGGWTAINNNAGEAVTVRILCASPGA